MTSRLLALLLIVLSFSSAIMGQRTLFSYMDVDIWNGDWHNTRTWTTVIDGTDITTDPISPANGDILIITEGTIVRLNQNVTTTGLHIEIRAGATLVLGTHEITAGVASLTGLGTLIINRHYYPAVSGNHRFGQAGGGTVVFNLGATGTLPTALSQANNIRISKTDVAGIDLTLAHNLQVAGNITVEKQNPASPSVFRFLIGNNTTVRNLNIMGDFLIGQGVDFRAGSFNAVHNISLSGNLTVNGVMDLSNAAQYQLATNGAANFTFTGARNTSVTGTGGTGSLDFYRLIVDKGIDQTYELDISHPALRLFFPTDQPNAGADPNPVINKALWIRNGTLILREGIMIPQLTSGGNDFMIPQNGALWIRGAVVHSTINSAQTGNTGITVLGTLRISAGTLRTNTSAGIVYRGQARIIVEGGDVTISQLRPSIYAGNHQASWTQSGGNVTVDGSGENHVNHPRFSIPLATHSFTMSGGVLNISNPNESNRGLVIGSDAGNTNVSGGVVNITVPDNRNFGLSTTAPFFQLNVSKTATTPGDLIIATIVHDFGTNQAQPLTVLSHMHLQANARLNVGVNNVNIGGNFTLDAGARYITGTNTTRFFWHASHGNNPTLVTVNDSLLLWPLTFHHLVFDKDIPNTADAAPGKDINFISPGRDFTGDVSFLIRTSGNIQHNVRRSRINLNGYSFWVDHQNISIEDFNAEGAIEWNNVAVLRLAGTAQHQLAIRGWHGLGPNRIILSNNAGARLIEDADLGNGILELANGILDIGSNLLSTNNQVAGTFTATRMIRTSGLPGDKGYRLRLRNITLTGSQTREFTFPVGTPGKYTPMVLRISVTGATDTGTMSDHNHFITVIPVNNDHPLVEDRFILRYYWKTEVQIDAGGTISRLLFDYRFTHFPGDAPGSHGSNRSMMLREGQLAWDVFNTWNVTPPHVIFPGQGLISADFTAGRNSSFQTGGRSPVFYSRHNGAWDVAATWSATGHTGGARSSTPDTTAVVIIAPGHTVTTEGDSRAAKSVRIERDGIASGVLDLGTTSGHAFQTVVGGGLLRLASANLPRVALNNYSNIAPFVFNDGGVIEFYGTTNYALPTDKFTYNNLIISGTGVKTLPAGTINIQGQLTLRDRGRLATNTAAGGTLNVNGLFLFDGRSTDVADRNAFIISRRTVLTSVVWTININDEMRFWESGEVSAEAGEGSTLHHTINLNGTLTEGRGRMLLRGLPSNHVDMVVRGGTNTDFGTGEFGGVWRFNRLIIDKENAANTVTINREIQLLAPTGGSDKALELRRGVLVLGQRSAAHPNIKDITLSSGGANFHIPVDAGIIIDGQNTIRASGTTLIDLDGFIEFRGNSRGLFGYTGSEATAPASTVDIVYGTAGARFEAHGNSVVHISGQLRRAELIPNGVLRYRQSGNSDVVIGTGAPAIASRGVLEILNAGSVFIMEQNSRLTIAEAADNAFPALLLQPASGLAGGTIVMGHQFTGTGEQLGVRSSIPLFNLHTHGQNTPVVYLHTNSLLLSGNKSIAAGGRFETRGFDLEIKGNMANSGTFISQTTETVTFSGNEQSISGTGSTTFSNLRLDAIQGLEMNKNILVTNNFNIVRGTFSDMGNTVAIGGNLTNNGVHVSDLAQGGILLNGTRVQEIHGLGLFGRLEINQTQPGIEAVAFSPITIGNALMLTNGILNIGSHRLTLPERVNITIPSGQSFGTGRMIRTGGGMGDGGIRKFFAASEIPGTFTFPLGTGSKYTPAIVALDGFPAGHHITVYNVNTPHPTIVTAAGGDPDRVLQYYWGVESDIDTRNMRGTLSFVYDNADIRGVLANYFTTQLQPGKDDTWAKHSGYGVPPTIIPADRMIIFEHRNQDASVVTGFYTAGEHTAIPDRVARFTARSNGRWESPSSWESGTVPHFGVVAEIPEGIDIRIEENMKRVYRTVINGHLRINPATTMHNLGIVGGSGTLEIEGTAEANPMNLPAGRFEQFTACNNTSTIMFTGAGGSLPANITQYSNLIISGSGTKRFPVAQNISICGNFDIRQTVTAESRIGQVLHISGNLRMENQSQARFGNTDNQIIMSGSMPQIIEGNFTGNNHIFRLRSNTALNLTVRGIGVDISDRLYIERGIIRNDNSVIRLLNPIPVAVSNHGNTRFIEGSLTRVLPLTSALEFEFPVAKNGRPRFVSLQNTSSPGNSEWTVEYFNADPGNNGKSRNHFSGSPLKISPVEFWRVDGPSGGRANVTLNWGPESTVSIDSAHLATMVVAEWTSSGWANRGRSHNNVGGGGFGRIASYQVTFSTKFFTLASTDLNNPLPIELISFKGRAEEGAVVLEWVTASEINNNFFTIERSIDGRNFEIIGYLDSKAPGGNSNHLLHYMIRDLNPPDGILYYRLKQTDYDGAYEYSEIIAVLYRSITSGALGIALHPNPSDGESFQILASGMISNENVILKITDMFGKNVLSQNLITDPNGNLVYQVIAQSKLRPGVYIVTVSGLAGRVSGRLVVR